MSPAIALLQCFLEHFNACDCRFGSVGQSDDLDFVADIDRSRFDTTGGNSSTAFDREYVFHGHQERLVGDSRCGFGDVLIESVPSVRRCTCWRLSSPGASRAPFAFATNDRNVISGEIVLRQQFANFHFDEFEQLFVVDEIALVEENHQGRHVHLASQQDVLAGLRHRAVGSRHDEDRPVHLSRTGDHVLNVVGVSRAVDVSVVTRFTLVFNVTRQQSSPSWFRHAPYRPWRYRHKLFTASASPFAACTATIAAVNGRFSVVDVANGPHVHVRLCPSQILPSPLLLLERFQ